MTGPIRLDPPFDPRNPPAKGTRFVDKSGFAYEVTEAKAHTNRDGTASCLLTFKCVCADCGGEFLTTQGPTRGNLPRRCPPHAKGKGREKTYPWGQAPTGGLMGPSAYEAVKAFANGFLDYLPTYNAVQEARGFQTLKHQEVEDAMVDYAGEEYPDLFGPPTGASSLIED